jgi:hypothetical protein
MSKYYINGEEVDQEKHAALLSTLELSTTFRDRRTPSMTPGGRSSSFSQTPLSISRPPLGFFTITETKFFLFISVKLASTQFGMQRILKEIHTG